jgi:hypothetical protein
MLTSSNMDANDTKIISFPGLLLAKLPYLRKRIGFYEAIQTKIVITAA